MIEADPLTKSAAMEAPHAYLGRQLFLSSFFMCIGLRIARSCYVFSICYA